MEIGYVKQFIKWLFITNGGFVEGFSWDPNPIIHLRFFLDFHI